MFVFLLAWISWSAFFYIIFLYHKWWVLLEVMLLLVSWHRISTSVILSMATWEKISRESSQVCHWFMWQGHLLVLENFKSFNLNHGLMEAGYVNHESAALSSTTSDSGTGYDANTASISMTATMDLSGRLVLGKFLSCGCLLKFLTVLSVH